MLPEFPEIALTKLLLFPAWYTQPHQGKLTPETPVKYSLCHLEKPGPTQPPAVAGSQPWSNVPMLPFVRWVPGLNVPLKVKGICRPALERPNNSSFEITRSTRTVAPDAFKAALRFHCGAERIGGCLDDLDLLNVLNDRPPHESKIIRSQSRVQ